MRARETRPSRLSGEVTRAIARSPLVRVRMGIKEPMTERKMDGNPPEPRPLRNVQPQNGNGSGSVK